MATWFFVLCICSLCGDLGELLSKKKEADQEKIWHYPYPRLVDELRAEGKKSILIFSYGSLMSVNSAKRTLSQASLSTRRPAVAYGLQRLFDRDVPIQGNSKWAMPSDPSSRGMLNIHPASIQEAINGVLIDVSLEDLLPLMNREVGYDLIPVVVEDWNGCDTKTSRTYMIAYTFHAPLGTIFTNSTILPRPGYYEMVRDAAAEFGPLFLSTWFSTTFLADGKTPVATWGEKEKSSP